MRPNGSPKLAPWHRRPVVWVAVLLALSGLVWMSGNALLLVDPDRDDPQLRSLLHDVVIAHGVLGQAGAVLFGSLLGRHVTAGLMQRRRVQSGSAAIALVSLLLITALLLYYGSTEELREIASWSHQALGVLAIGVVWGHIALRDRPR